jgi:uncharacterized protein DUF4386
LTADTAAGVLLIVVPVAFNTFFFLLQRRFDYPDILRKPTPEVLERFRAGGTGLVAVWYGFALTSVAFVPLVVLLHRALAEEHASFLPGMVAVGTLAGVVQFIGLARWPFAVPHLARVHADPSASEAERAAAAMTFQTLNRYAGVAIGEHLGYLLTGTWTIMVSLAVADSAVVPSWIGWVGLVPAVGILVGLLEPAGWKPAGAINAAGYLVWSLWLITLGVGLLA